MQYSLLSRPVGTILDFVVHDSFNFQNYPYFGKIQKELNARLTELKDRLAVIWSSVFPNAISERVWHIQWRMLSLTSS